MKRFFAGCLLLAAAAVGAQSVSLQGMIGSKPLLVIDGGAPKAVGAGETWKGVKVLSATGEQAVVEVGGQRQILRVGESPLAVGATAAPKGNKIVLNASSGGHFLTLGAINGRAVQFMVDTGATSIAMGVAEAERLGIDYRKGQLARGNTANGQVTVYQVKLASVRVGDVEVYDVDAAILPSHGGNVLLGNSFLSRFQMTKLNDQLVLERRY